MPRGSVKTNSAYRIIRERIERNDYREEPFPSERKLAAQLGVSHPTARKAVQCALRDGLLERGSNGRLLVGRRYSASQRLEFAFIAPVDNNAWIWDWIKGLRQVADQRDARLRVVHYVDENDASLMEALDGAYDLAFFVAPRQINRLLADRLRALRGRLVSVVSDLRAHGVPWLENSPLHGMDLLLEHLHGLGHRRIACVVAEVADRQPRLERYREAMQRLKLAPLEAREAVPADWFSAQRGYRFMARELKERTLAASAYVFTTIDPAFGALRACHEAGVRPGADLSIAAFGPSLRARLMVPALTSLQTPSHATVVADAIDRLLMGGSLPLESAWPVTLFAGESTGRAPA